MTRNSGIDNMFMLIAYIIFHWKFHHMNFHISKYTCSLYYRLS